MLKNVCWTWRIWLAAIALESLMTGCGGSLAAVPPEDQQLNPPVDTTDQNGNDEHPANTNGDQAPPAVDPEPVEPPQTPAATTLPTGDAPVQINVPPPAGEFGAYVLPAVKLPAAYSQPLLELPVDLTNVTCLDHYELSDGQQALLSQNGFVLTPAQNLEFHTVYQQTADNYADERPVFVTVDSLLHVYHLAFDKLLRDLEDEQLYPVLTSLTGMCVAEAAGQYEECRGTVLEDPARRVWAYFEVARQLALEAPGAPPAEIASLVDAELARITAHSGICPSPVVSISGENEYLEDYSQYIPRGHYTRTAQRQRYFKTMMWYGRINYRLQVPDETRMALLITRVISASTTSTQAAPTLWSQLYDPIAFLVGQADDLSLREYGAVASAVYGPETTLAELADDALLSEFIAAAKKLPSPRILSLPVTNEPVDEQTQGFRFMGQRFVLDGYIFTQLLHPKVDMRLLPNGLDVWTALGNTEAAGILSGLGETGYSGYATQLAKLQTEMTGLPDSEWQANVYSSWLDMLRAVVDPKGKSYPPFMRTSAWARKDLHSALGSWAELKHDKILYAKQPMTCGAAPPPDTPPMQHWVEPCPEAYARLRALCSLTQDGLAKREILTSKTENLLESLSAELFFIQRVAEQELAGELLIGEDSLKLKYYGDWLEHMINKAADIADPGDPYADQVDNEPAAIVADVATDAWNGKVLEVGTGRVFEIYIVVPDGAGGLQLARGSTYSYYEFAWPSDDRLTDEAWRAIVAAGEQPAQPAWTASFICE